MSFQAKWIHRDTKNIRAYNFMLHLFASCLSHVTWYHAWQLWHIHCGGCNLIQFLLSIQKFQLFHHKNPFFSVEVLLTPPVTWTTCIQTVWFFHLWGPFMWQLFHYPNANWREKIYQMTYNACVIRINSTGLHGKFFFPSLSDCFFLFKYSSPLKCPDSFFLRLSVKKKTKILILWVERETQK